MIEVLDRKKVYGTKHLIELTQTELLITESKYFNKDLIREIPIIDIVEINFVKVNGGNNSTRFFITRILGWFAAIILTLVSEGGFTAGSFDKDHFEIKYYHEDELIHSIFQTDLKDGDIEEMRLQIKEQCT